MSKVLVDRELLPCPFCGQQDAFVEQLDSDASVVICQGRIDEYSACLARGPVGVQQSEMEDQPGRDAAIAEWNRRAQPAEAEGVEAVEFWVLFDATTPEPYIKKMMPEGFLAFFDHEEDAIRAKSFHPGTDYKRVPYVRQSDHLAALSAVTAERDALAARLGEWERSKLAQIMRENVELTAERDRLRDQVKALQSDANSWQSGYDKGRHDGTKHRHSEVAQLRAEVEASRLLLEQCNEVIAEDGGVYIELRAFLAGTMPASDVIALLRDAAMAAKEA